MKKLSKVKVEKSVDEIDQIFSELNEESLQENNETIIEDNDIITEEDEALAEEYFNPELFGEKPIKTSKVKKEKSTLPKTPKTPSVKQEDTTGLLTNYIKSKINQSIIWIAINEEYRNNEKALKTLSETYPELYTNAAKYFKKCPENALIHSSVKELELV